MNVLLLPCGITAFTEYSIHLANALSDQVDVHLPLRLCTKADYFKLIKPQVHVTWYDDVDRLSLRRLAYLRTICTLAHKVKPVVVHLQQGDIWLSLLLPKLNQSAIVTTIHDVVRHSGEKTHLGNLIDKLTVRATTVFITHGQSLRSDLVKLRGVPEARISVIPLGEMSYARQLVGELTPDDGRTILFFGRMKKYKGLDVLIKAIPLVRQSLPDAHFIIAGSGEELEAWKNQLNTDPSVTVYNGYLSNEQVGKMLNQATVVVLPYHEASQSGIVSVAYPFGKPVIATRVGALPEVVEDGITGFLVPPRDPGALAEAIVRVLMDEQLRQRMGNAALHKARTDLAWGNIAEMTLEVYRDAQRVKSLAQIGMLKEFPPPKPE